MKKHDGIDLMKLYTLGSANGWNEFLHKCYKNKNIDDLAKVKYQISVGMDNLAKQKLNTNDINNWFARCIRSLEITAKKIIKLKYPNPLDTMISTDLSKLSVFEKEKITKNKRQRDEALKEFFRKSSY